MRRRKRPERQFYKPPALRTELNYDYEETIEYAKDQYASEAANSQAHSFRNRDSSQRTSSKIVPMRVQFDSSSSSSNPRNTFDESCKDYDSSDFEECCSEPSEAMSEEEIRMGTNENISGDHWNKEQRGNATENHTDIETENYQTNTKIPSSTLIENAGNSNAKYHTNQLLNFESNETKHDRESFFNYDDYSISDIETIGDDHKTMGRVLTSTPNSDIVEQKVLDAAKYSPEDESWLESTLLGQSDIRENTIDTNSKKCDYNFDIYQDPSSVKSEPTDFSEIFGNDYIPPPVPFPLPLSTLQLPPIHRLPSLFSSPYQPSVPRHVSFQRIPQSSIRLQHPRLLFHPSLQLRPRLPASSFTPPNSDLMPPVPRYVSPSRLQAAPSRASNPPRMPSSMPPTVSPQERFETRRSPQGASYPQYLHQRNLNPRSVESYKQYDSVYIPPPVPPPQRMNGMQPNRNLNQRENAQSGLPNSRSLVNRNFFDEKIWPQDPETRR